jgi:F0F1-type ATP synthase alpha subunit
LYKFVENSHPSLLSDIREKKELTDDIKKAMKDILAEFKTRFVAEHVKR